MSRGISLHQALQELHDIDADRTGAQSHIQVPAAALGKLLDVLPHPDYVPEGQELVIFVAVDHGDGEVTAMGGMWCQVEQLRLNHGDAAAGRVLSWLCERLEAETQSEAS